MLLRMPPAPSIWRRRHEASHIDGRLPSLPADVTTPAVESIPARTLPATRLEPVVVLGGIVALWSAGFAWRAATGDDEPVRFTDATLAQTLVVEAVIAALLVPWLRRRGWSPGAIAGAPSPLDVLRGVGVWLGGLACYGLVATIVNLLAPDVLVALAAEPFQGAVAPLTIVLVSLWNPVFEEFLWLGYAVPTLEPRLGLRAACLISIALRTAVHLYQGSAAFIGVLPLGLFLTWYYGRTRLLWPVVVAHVIWDALGLSQFVR